MTKVELIRELTRIRLKFVKSLDIIYHNHSSKVRYIYSYNYVTCSSLDARRELARVVFSLFKLRKYVEFIRVVYFPFDDKNEECILKYASDIHYVQFISDFINHIKPIKK